MEQKENKSQSSTNEQSELEKYKKNLHSKNFLIYFTFNEVQIFEFICTLFIRFGSCV